MISRRKKVVFAVLTIGLVFTGLVVLLLAADLVLHYRAERSAGLNRWGYRGPVLGRKQPGEVRAAMLGGSTVFGYGVPSHESLPAFLELNLNRRQPDRKWTVVNLGYNTEGAFAFVANLKDFAYLDFDLVILYEGYNDLWGDQAPNLTLVRQASPIFRRTGYFPILPLWLSERSLMLRTGGDITKAYDRMAAERKQQTVFRPSVADRASASALDAVAAMASAFERQFDRSPPPPQTPPPASELGCPYPWASYCASQHRAIEYALAQGKRVLVVAQPNLTTESPGERHASQRQALAGMMQREYGNNRRVAFVELGGIVDLADLDVAFDLMHLSVDGNKIVGAALADAVITLWSAQ